MAHDEAPAVTLRDARPEDTPALQRIHAAGTMSSYGKVHGFLRPILEDPATPLEPADWTLVAEIDGRPAGYVAVTGHHVENLYVDPAAQGRGVGEALLRAAEARIEGEVTLRCLHDNPRARRFYERLGYSVRESQSITYHGARLAAWYMVKPR